MDASQGAMGGVEGVLSLHRLLASFVGGTMLTRQSQQHDQHGYESRQSILDALRETVHRVQACAACTTSAALYLAVLASIGIGYTREEFMELTSKVWADLARQQKAQDN